MLMSSIFVLLCFQDGDVCVIGLFEVLVGDMQVSHGGLNMRVT